MTREELVELAEELNKDFGLSPPIPVHESNEVIAAQIGYASVFIRPFDILTEKMTKGLADLGFDIAYLRSHKRDSDMREVLAMQPRTNTTPVKR